jgi:hypothetical protein
MVHITLFVAFYFTSSQTKLWSYGKNGLEIQNSFLDLQPIQGTIAQLVEQRTENPCVAGSIPAGTTKINANFYKRSLRFLFWLKGLPFTP